MSNADGVRRAEVAAATESDPLLSNTSLPLRTIYFPLGFPVELASNSSDVMAAAEQSWGHCQLRFAETPLILRIGVTADDDCPGVPPAPVFRSQWNLLSNVADGRNFVITDLKEGRSYGWVTQSTVASPLYFRYHILEAAGLSMVSFLRAAPVHAACVSFNNKGMLLCGDSGAGKSTLAFACARAGWTFTSDDSSYIPMQRSDRLVVGNSHQFRLRSSGVLLFPELEGRTVTPRAAGKPSIEIPTSEMPELVTANTANVDYIVFLNRNCRDGLRLVTLRRDLLLAWFGRYLITSVESVHAQTQAIQRLLSGAGSFELQYQDLDDAVERLKQLALTGE